MGYTCKCRPSLKFLEANYRPQAVEKEIAGWMTKLKEACGVEDGPSVHQKMVSMWSEMDLLEELKAATPSRHESKITPSRYESKYKAREERGSASARGIKVLERTREHPCGR